MRKRIAILMLLLVVMVFGMLSVSARDVSVDDYSWLKEQLMSDLPGYDNGYQIGPVDVSALSEEKLAIWRKIMKEDLTDPDRIVIFHFRPTSAVIPKVTILSFERATFTTSARSERYYGRSENIRYAVVTSIASGFRASTVVSYPHSVEQEICDSYPDACFWSPCTYDFDDTFPKLVDIGALKVFDNDEENETEPPVSGGGGEADTGGGIGRPDIRPPSVSMPEIPKGNGYVPYDTSRWLWFLQWVFKAVGNVVVICFCILAIILGLLAAIKIVRSFTSLH